MNAILSSWALVCHADNNEQRTVSVLSESDESFKVDSIQVSEHSGKDADKCPVFIGVGNDGQAIVLDVESKKLALISQLPSDVFPAYAYRDSDCGFVWFMNDGDKKTGNDSLNCGDTGSSVTVINPVNDAPELVKTICVGRGHHVTAFTAPSDKAPDMPRRAFVSNLLDGTISVIGNDPEDGGTFLKVIDTINLCESEKEKDEGQSIPNNAFPHGMEFSSFTGKIYCFNNGYGTVAVINPITNVIEGRIELKGCSNILLSPDSRFLIGKGADRKTDSEHVIGRLAVIDIEAGKVIATQDLPDVYPSTYRFSPDGNKLYVTTAATGKGVQKENLDIDSVFVYDVSTISDLKCIKKITVGVADCGRRPLAFYSEDDSKSYLFIPNPTDGTVSVIDVSTDLVIESPKVFSALSNEVNFSFWRGDIYGA